jgi:hypothetical protein
MSGPGTTPLAGFLSAGYAGRSLRQGRRQQNPREQRMTSRPTFLTIVVAAAALGFGSLGAVAAMPVTGKARINAGSDIVQAQAPPAAAEPTAGEKKAAKKKSAKKSETDQSIESGTVPKRYKSSVPKEYHHLIPFAK